MLSVPKPLIYVYENTTFSLQNVLKILKRRSKNQKKIYLWSPQPRSYHNCYFGILPFGLFKSTLLFPFPFRSKNMYNFVSCPFHLTLHHKHLAFHLKIFVCIIFNSCKISHYFHYHNWLEAFLLFGF